jgi:hypothetical protein
VALPDSNGHVQPTQPDDVISADPRTVSSRTAWLVVVTLLAAALTGAIIAAVHYREEATALRRVRPARTLATPRIAPPVLSSVTTALPSSGALTGELTVFAVRSSAGLAQVIVTVRISGGQPHSRYQLYAGDCADNADDHNWAAGVTDARGSADLASQVWTVSMSDEYYLVVGSRRINQDHPGPAVHGHFGIVHGLSPVRDSIAPCAP